MKAENQNSKVLARVSELFKGSAPKEVVEKKPPVRMTCTRLKKFRGTKQNIVIDPELSLASESEIAPTPSIFDDSPQKKGSFAVWVEKSQEEPNAYQLLEKQSRLHQNAKRIAHEADRTMQGFEHFSSTALQQIAKDPNVPINTLKWLAAHYDIAVHRALASNPSLSLDIFIILARDIDRGVKLTLLENGSFPRDEVIRFSQEPDLTIAERAKERLNPFARTDSNSRHATDATANIEIPGLKSIKRKIG